MKNWAHIWIVGLVLLLAQTLCAQTPIDQELLHVTDSVHQPDSTMLAMIDSLNGLPDSLRYPHSLLPDSLLPDSLRYPKPKISNQIDAKIDYQAQDSLMMLGNGTAFLFGSTEMSYKTIGLKADFVRVKMDSSTLFAAGTLDTTTNEWKGRPVFTEGEESYETNELSYNLKTRRAYIRHVVAEQGEGYIIASEAKKTENDELMMKGGRYTTCDDHEHPHFYLNITKGKVKPGEYVAAGPAYLVVGDVPLPLAVPFGFFPFNQTYSSGLIMPNFGDDQTRGLYMQGLGYYFALSDYVDLELTGDIYTRGTWAIRAKSRYVLRYKFSGNLSVDYRTDVIGDKDMPDYRKNTNFQMQWTHTQDSKANPYSNFSASVNFSTSGYNRSNINSYYDPTKNSENTKASSVTYTQRFPDSPWSLTMSANITQRTKDSTIMLTLPDINVSMSQIKPFKRKKPVGKEKWFEKISLRYTMNGKISIDCKENYLLHSNFLRDWKTGVKHSIPVSASFTAFKYINITPSLSYTERWYFQRMDQHWDDELNKAIKDTTTGFYRVWDLNASVSMSTKLYGFFIPSRKLFPNSKVDRFRHVMTPSISFSYVPDCEAIRAKLDHNYYGSYIDPNRETPVEYNRFQGAMFSTPGKGNTAKLSFDLGNNLEMKVLNLKDTTGKEPTKIISLIDNLSIRGGYNFVADSMKWDNFGVTLRLKLPKKLNSFSINLATTFDPYVFKLDTKGKPYRSATRCWQVGRGPRFMGTGTSFSYTFSNETIKKLQGKADKKKDDVFDPGFDMDDPYATDRETGELITPERREQAKKDEQAWKKKHRHSENEDVDDDGWSFAEIPWSIGLSYSINYRPSNEFDYDKMIYKLKLVHNLNASFQISLGKGWRASTSMSYDFNAKKLAASSIQVSRDLHCWSMSATFVPFGPFKSYTFHIGVNASMLSDLKYDTSSQNNTNEPVHWW